MRNFSRACEGAEKLSGEVESGVTRITVEDAVNNWLAFRKQEGMNSEKAKLMSARLVKFCHDRKITLMSEITGAHLTALRATLPYKTTTSSSLKIHWSVLGGFFGWSVTAGYLTANPVPKFRTKFRKPEVVPPTVAEVNRVLTIEKTKLFAAVMRYNGMAIQDTATLKRSSLADGNLIIGNRAKTHELFRVRIPMWLAEELCARSCNDAEYFFWHRGDDGRKLKVTSIVHYYRARLTESFKAAGVDMTSHGFRHFFITQMLSTGTSVEDVSKMVGTSPNEIRKTYEHWIPAAMQRLDDVQRQAWLASGLDEDGNPRKEVVQ